MKICILYSGGLDSLIMLHLAKIEYPDDEISLCYYDLGQEYNFKELAVLPDNVKIRKIQWIEDGVGVVGKENTQNIMIPGRNMALAVMAACQEVPDEIWMGALMGEVHEDATDKNFEFLSHLNSLLGYVLAPYGKKPRVKFPLASKGWGKFEATRWYVNNGGEINALIDSSSCLSKESTDDCDNCGHCIVCLRRWGIFSQLGIFESYIHHPIDDISPENKKVLVEMYKGECGLPCHYDGYRRREIMPALITYAEYKGVKLEELFQ